MTEEERSELITVKHEATALLSSLDLSAYRLRAIDTRLDRYVRSIARDPKGHNVFEQLAVLRFLSMIEKYGFNVAYVKTFYKFYESLYFPGKQGMTQYKLTPVQCFQFAAIFGFWKNGRRVVREACLYVPRKFSKTTSSAAFAVWDVLFGDNNAECYTGANSQDQAKKCFDAIRGCFWHLDPTESSYRVNEQKIKSIRADRIAFAQCLTAGARTKDGLNASTVIMDEFSQARDSSLLTVLTTSMGMRDNPLTVIITTASDVFDGPFYSMLQGYKQVLLGNFEDDALFAHIFEPDVDDAEDDPATWRKVHPHLGVTVNEDFYEAEYRKAKRDGSEAMLAFRTKLLNIYAENERAVWIPAEQIRKCYKPIDANRISGKPDAMVAIDLSVRDDFSAVTFAYNDRGDNLNFHTKYFFPKGALPGHPNERLYRAWAAAGHLELLEGEVIDYDAIVDYILWLNDRLCIIGIGYDRYKSQQMINQLAAHPDAQGVDTVLKDISQLYGNFTAPVETFQYGAYNGRLWIDDNPITAYCFGNAVLDYDSMENCKPVKRQHNMKIDGVITMLMCVRQWLDVVR